MVSLQISWFFQNKKYQKQLQVILDKSKWCLLWVATFWMLTSYITLCEVSWRICPHSRASWVLLTFHFSLFVPLSVCLLCAVQTILPTKFFQFHNCYQKYPLIKTKTAFQRKIISHNPINWSPRSAQASMERGTSGALGCFWKAGKGRLARRCHEEPLSKYLKMEEKQSCFQKWRVKSHGWL